jgi:hypothetical protein
LELINDSKLVGRACLQRSFGIIGDKE